MTGQRQKANSWDGQNADWWQRQLDVPAVYAYESVASTNDVARELAERGAESLTVVVTDEQTQGRGRSGGQWVSTPGTSLICSIVFRPAAELESASGAAPVRIGNAVASAIAQLAHVDAKVKWPNDVVIPDHGKVAGILCEAAARQQGSVYVVAGIGVNLASPREGYAGIADASNVAITRGELLRSIIDQLRSAAQHITAPLSAAELQDIRGKDILLNQELESDDGLLGRACGILPDGALQIATRDGVKVVYTASVRLAGTHVYPGARA